VSAEARVSQNLQLVATQVGLEASVPLPLRLEKSGRIFKLLAARCGDFGTLGRAMAWMVFNFSRLELERGVSLALRQAVLGKSVIGCAVHRSGPQRIRYLFPLPLGVVSNAHEAAQSMALDDFCNAHFALPSAADVWLALGILGVNGLAGHGHVAPLRKGTEAQKEATKAIGRSINRVLDLETRLTRTCEQAEKELSSRFLSYSGEEVPKMQVLTLKAAQAALPPVSHGGSIDALGLVSEGTRRLLEHPEESLLETPKEGVKLQAKVHISPHEALEYFQLLVERRICTWVADEDVLRVNNQQVLNGMFAVGKNTFLSTGEEVQRTIMNLIPTNACFSQVEGATGDLPSICQYLSLVLNRSEKLAMFQSDMSSAFYLFKLPACWAPNLAFNIAFPGESLGLQKGTVYRPACSVIPMGWHSAVSVMQEIAERLTVLGRLPASHRVRRTSPLPVWLTDTLDLAESKGKPWYHVYLDNFCAMEKVGDDPDRASGAELHLALEKAWERAGVLSSAKKRVSEAGVVQELGAQVDGVKGTLGPSPERLLKLVQSTLVVLAKGRLRKKWVQVIAGRWVHCMVFRRPAMAALDYTWMFISGQVSGESVEAKVRGELFGCCLMSLLVHTSLRSTLSEVTTASDASSTGGAVGKSVSLSKAGSQFVGLDRGGQTGGLVIPVLVLSLFNGIGCAFRCYDLCGVRPMVAISYELNAAANRITSRRWPHVEICKDVRSIDLATIKRWRYLHPEVEEVHVWAGFPCVDLSRVKLGRQNLEGDQSSLFFEIPRIVKDIRKVYGYSFKVRYVVENVSSMDAAAEGEISQVLGGKPLRLDPCHTVPIHRPRFCWSNTDLAPMDGVDVQEKERWVEITIQHPFPELSQWLEPGAEWPGFQEGATLPTCMKCIKRSRPPPAPAGLDRVDHDGKCRWVADDFKFPPYQYHHRFIIWVGNRWRLISSLERELLHGLGAGHTSLCWNASDIKRSPQEYEDLRKTLVGDSFSCYSFSYVAAMLVQQWVSVPRYGMLANRMGMPPGFCCSLDVEIPLTRELSYGLSTKSFPVSGLHSCLLRRVNHTGSDVRIASGLVLNPKAFPRQSALADWWEWSKVFAYRWQKHDHINSLELRSIIHAIEWRVRHLKEHHVRIFHLTDSYICMSIISKGRSSSRMLKPLLRRLGAILLTFDLQLIISHVESTENPTDHDSRA